MFGWFKKEVEDMFGWFEEEEVEEVVEIKELSEEEKELIAKEIINLLKIGIVWSFKVSPWNYFEVSPTIIRIDFEKTTGIKDDWFEYIYEKTK